MKQRTKQPNVMPHIGIIGAGVSGLRCADLLLQRGFKVTILEGRERLGGRMCQERLPSGHLVDLGPNWIHGTVDNPVLDILKQVGSVAHSWEEKPNLFDESGNLLSAEESVELSETMWGIVLEAFEYSKKNTAIISHSASLYDFFLKMVKEKYPVPSVVPGSEEITPTIAEHERKQKIVLQISQMWGAFVGSPVETQSLKFFWLDECIDGENLFCADTYEKVLAQIAKTAEEKAEILYSTEVKRILSEPQEGKLKKVTVETVKGGQFQFDEIVMTAPLGWLQKHQDAFVPAIPERLTKAINSIGYGCLEKVYITFPRAFWQDRFGSGAKLRGINQQEMNSKDETKSNDDPKEEFAGFIQWLSPNYSKDNPKKWGQEVVNLASLPKSCAHPTLLFYIFGDQSKTLSTKLAKIPDAVERKRYLEEFYKPYYSLLSNYSPDNSDCHPSSIYATDWLSDDLAGNGSYSNFQIGLKEGHGDIIAMREGLPDRGVWFAGEHTAPFVAMGTVTGAYWSGEAVGKRIAEAYGFNEDISYSKAGIGAEKQKEVNVRGFGDQGLEA